MRFHYCAHTVCNLKLMNCLFLESSSSLLDLSWLQVTETTYSKTTCKMGLLYLKYSLPKETRKSVITTKTPFEFNITVLESSTITRKLTPMHIHRTTCLVVRFHSSSSSPENLDTHLKDLLTSLSLFWTPHSIWVACPISEPSFFTAESKICFIPEAWLSHGMCQLQNISLHFFSIAETLYPVAWMTTTAITQTWVVFFPPATPS